MELATNGANVKCSHWKVQLVDFQHGLVHWTSGLDCSTHPFTYEIDEM